jgi:hypothetical protein
MLAACGQPSSATPPAATSPAPTVTPIRVDLTPAQRAAMQALVEAITVPIDQVRLISTEAVQWPDGCLGIVRMGVMCSKEPVDGLRIILEANGQQYEFHANQDGTVIGQLTKAPFVSIAVRAPMTRFKSSTRKCQSICGPLRSGPVCGRWRVW